MKNILHVCVCACVRACSVTTVFVPHEYLELQKEERFSEVLFATAQSVEQLATD